MKKNSVFSKYVVAYGQDQWYGMFDSFSEAYEGVLNMTNTRGIRIDFCTFRRGYDFDKMFQKETIINFI